MRCLDYGYSLIVSLPLYSSSPIHSHPFSDTFFPSLLLSSFPFLFPPSFPLSHSLIFPYSLILPYSNTLSSPLFSSHSHSIPGWHKVIVCLVARIRRNMCLSDCHIPFLLLLHYSSLIFKPICVGIAAMTSMAHNKI